MTDDPVTPNPNSLEQAIAAFREMPVPDGPADDELMARLEAPQPFGTAPVPRPRRRLSFRRVFPYAGAAAVLLAIVGWALLGQAGSVALADVIRAAESHRFVRYKQQQIVDEGHKGPPAPSRTVLADLRAFRIRSEGRVIEGNLESVSVAIQDARKNRTLILSTDTDLRTGKVVTRVATVDKVVREDFKPFRDLKPYQPLLDHLRELQNHKGTTVTKDSLGGRKAVKYRLEDDGRSVVVWVDPGTKLPVRMEYEMTAPDGLRYKFAFTDFEWDPEVRNIEQHFSTTPPEGYLVRDYTREGGRGRPKQ